MADPSVDAPVRVPEYPQVNAGGLDVIGEVNGETGLKAGPPELGSHQKTAGDMVSHDNLFRGLALRDGFLHESHILLMLEIIHSW